MPRKSVAKSRCALCGAKEVSEPRGEEKYCRDWVGTRRSPSRRSLAREFALKRYGIRAHTAPRKYLIYHSTAQAPLRTACSRGRRRVRFVPDLDALPELRVGRAGVPPRGLIPRGGSSRKFWSIVVAAEVIEPWGGGKWHMEILRPIAINPEPEDWNGEMISGRGSDHHHRDPGIRLAPRCASPSRTSPTSPAR